MWLAGSPHTTQIASAAIGIAGPPGRRMVLSVAGIFRRSTGTDAAGTTALASLEVYVGMGLSADLTATKQSLPSGQTTVIAATALAWCALAMRLGANFFLVAVGAALLLGTTSIHWLARPHVFTFLLAGLWTYQLEDVSERRSRRLWLFPLLMWLWVNLHGGFLLGLVVMTDYLFGKSVELRWPRFGDAGITPA